MGGYPRVGPLPRPGWGGTLGQAPHLDLDGGYPGGYPRWGGTQGRPPPRPGWGGTPGRAPRLDLDGGGYLGPPRLDLDGGGTPGRAPPCQGTPPHQLDGVPPPPADVNRQTPVKTVPFRRTTYAVGNKTTSFNL